MNWRIVAILASELSDINHASVISVIRGSSELLVHIQSRLFITCVVHTIFR